MDSEGEACPNEGGAGAPQDDDNNLDNLNSIQALRVQAEALQREQAALIETIALQECQRKAKRSKRKRRRHSSTCNKGNRKIILINPHRKTEPSLAKHVLKQNFKNRIVTETEWPTEMMSQLPHELKQAQEYARQQQRQVRGSAPSEFMHGAAGPGVCPRAPKPPCRGARMPPKLPMAASPCPAARKRTCPNARKPPASSKASMRHSEKQVCAKKQGLKEEEQLLKKLTTKQKQVVDIEMQKLKEEETALLKNLQKQRQHDAAIDRLQSTKQEEITHQKRSIEEKIKPMEKRKFKREAAELKKQKATVEKLEKDWLLIEEKQLIQKQKLLAERAMEIEIMLQKENAQIQKQRRRLQQQMQEEQEKLQHEEQQLEDLKREQEELDSFEQLEKEQEELDSFEQHEREMEEGEACDRASQEQAAQSCPCPQQAFPRFDPDSPVDLTLDYRPLPPANYPETSDTDDQTCDFPGL
ncbi:uncharacterized protein [Scyliorhinus torazame]|uniref:uncharacterized protein n=1 Tax=Scyliorhinus torazame TaxID=75743 RepID=UPI003B5A2980